MKIYSWRRRRIAGAGPPAAEESPVVAPARRRRPRRPASPRTTRYPSDLTDAQWELIEPLLPEVKTGGRPEKHPRREIVNAIIYHVRAGGAWRMLPSDFPPWETVYWYFAKWTADGSLDRVHDTLRRRVREKEGRGADPSAGVVDSQALRGAETVGAARRGYDVGKATNGTKRHIVVDTIGLLLAIMVTAASVQDRDGGRSVLTRLRSLLPSVSHIWADGGYAGKLVEHARTALALTVEVVRKPADQVGFAVLPRRWVVERTFAWLMRHRRLVRDYERHAATHEAMVKWAMVALMARRLRPGPGRQPWTPKPAS
jgi:transposase